MEPMPIRNQSDKTLRVMIEPLARVYDVPPGGEILIRPVSSEGSDRFEVEVWPDNFLSVWVPGDVLVESDGRILPPVLDA
jgi:hypothetical protein